MSPSVFNGDSWLNVFRSDPLLPDLQLTQSSSLNMAALFEFLQELERNPINYLLCSLELVGHVWLVWLVWLVWSVWLV